MLPAFLAPMLFEMASLALPPTPLFACARALMAPSSPLPGLFRLSPLLPSLPIAGPSSGGGGEYSWMTGGGGEGDRRAELKIAGALGEMAHPSRPRKVRASVSEAKMMVSFSEPEGAISFVAPPLARVLVWGTLCLC